MNFDKLEKIMELNGIVSLAEIARNRTLSKIGTELLSASSRTRQLKEIHDNSLLKNLLGSSLSTVKFLKFGWPTLLRLKKSALANDTPPF